MRQKWDNISLSTLSKIKIGITVSIILLSGIYFSFTVFKKYEKIKIDKYAFDIASFVQKEISLSSIKLASLIGLYYSTQTNVKIEGFNTFVNLIMEHDSPIESIEWIPKVQGSLNRKQLETKLNSKGYLNFSISENDVNGKIVKSREKEIYFPITYNYPYQKNIYPHGFDLFSVEERKKELIEAIHSGKITASEPIKHDNNSQKNIGYFIFSPIFNNFESKKNIENTKGFIALFFNINKLLKIVLNNSTMPYELFLFDITDKDTKSIQLTDFNNKIYPNENYTLDENIFDLKFAGTEQVFFANRSLSIVLLNLQPFFYSPNIEVFYFGLILTILISILTGLFMMHLYQSKKVLILNSTLKQSNENLEYEVNVKNKSLTEVNRKLSENIVELSKQGKVALSLMNDAVLKANEAKRAESKLNAVIQTAADAIISSNQFGMIISVNTSALQQFGYSSEELIGENLNKLMPEPYKSEHDSYIANYLNTNKKKVIGMSREVIAKRKDGSTFPALLSIGETKDGSDIFFTGFIRDISLLKEKEAHLKRSNEELEQFAFIASHDLQTPLRHIASFTQLLSKKYENITDNETKEWMNFIVDGVTRMKKLINDLLTLSQVGRSLDNSKTVVNLNNVWSRVISSFSFEIKETNAKIDSSKLPNIFVNETQIQQLFQNLLGNALKFRKKNISPIVSLICTENKLYWNFSFKDNGIGFEMSQSSRIFQIFQRLHGKAEFEGTGIGLSICKKVVELHGGEISVNSTPDTGTEFLFSLKK